VPASSSGASGNERSGGAEPATRAPEHGPRRSSRVSRTGLPLGVALFFLTFLFDLEPGNAAVTRMAAVAVLMATWWITDAIPLAATALLPVILFPLLGIAGGGVVAPIYFNSTIMLYLGGFMIALSMERWNLHRRIALAVIGLIGGGPARIVLSFMLASAFLSMWISNTATAVMMVPIGLAIILAMETDFGREETRMFSTGLMLGIAYACSVGGLSTLVGTPPNLSLVRIFAITFPDAPPITFGPWLIMGFPISVVMLATIWTLLTKVFFRVPAHITIDRSIVKRERADLGAMSFEEKAVAAIFAITAGLWVFRVRLDLGFVAVPGWSELFADPDLFDDGTVAIAMAAILFFIPTRSPNAGATRVAGADLIPRLPWDIVLLFGGGFALAYGFRSTGLSELIGQQFTALAGAPPILLVAAVCLVLTFLTELTSNLATTEMVLPILASVAVAAQVHPLLLMIPATLSASCAFMLPVATPPNAIIFGSGRVRIADMAKVGLAINFAGVVIITAIFYLLAMRVFGIEPGVMPDWARAAMTIGR
jgi:sodium-dependent dicarboxylate transporter 2/3/5